MYSDHVTTVDRKRGGGGQRGFVENGTNYDHIRPCFVYGGGGMPGRRAGSGVGQVCTVHCGEPKTGQQKV